MINLAHIAQKYARYSFLVLAYCTTHALNSGSSDAYTKLFPLMAQPQRNVFIERALAQSGLKATKSANQLLILAAQSAAAREVARRGLSVQKPAQRPLVSKRIKN